MGPAQITPPFCYKIVSMQFCNITISHSSTPYDILGEMFQLLSILAKTFMYLPTTLKQVLLLPVPVFAQPAFGGGVECGRLEGGWRQGW